MATTYTVEIRHEDQTKVLEMAAGAEQTILEAAEDAGLDMPKSCSSGVCTTCAGRILKGEVEDVKPGSTMGLSPDLQQEFALLCVTRPASDVVIETGCEDEVYQRQFGQP